MLLHHFPFHPENTTKSLYLNCIFNIVQLGHAAQHFNRGNENKYHINFKLEVLTGKSESSHLEMQSKKIPRYINLKHHLTPIYASKQRPQIKLIDCPS